MNRRFSVLVLAMIAVLLSERGFAQSRGTGPVVFYGVVNSSCGAFLRAVEEERAAWARHHTPRADNQFISSAYVQYVVAAATWISAINYTDLHNYRWPNVEDILMLIEVSCRRDPLRYFIDGLVEIDQQRSRFRSP